MYGGNESPKAQNSTSTINVQLSLGAAIPRTQDMSEVARDPVLGIPSVDRPQVFSVEYDL